MGAIWYRTRSTLRAEWRRAAGVTVLVAIIGAVLLSLAAGVARTASAPGRYSDAQGSEYDVALEQFSGAPLTDKVRRLPAVRSAASATFVFAGLTARGSDPIDALVFAGDPRAIGGRPRDGQTSRPTAPGEFVATRAWLDAADAEVGDHFELHTFTQGRADSLGFGGEPDGPVVAATLVGVIDGPTELEDPAPVAVFPISLLEVGDIGVATSVGVVALVPGATIDVLRAQLDTLPEGGQFGLDEHRWVPLEVRSAVRAQAQGLAVVTGIVALAAVAVLGQLLSRRVRLPPGQRKVMSAIGLTRAQVVADPLLATAVPVAIGAAGATILAAAVSGLFPIGFARRLEPAPGIRVDPFVHGVGVLVFGVALMTWVLLALVLADRGGQGVHSPGSVDRLVSRFRAGPAATGARFALLRHPRDAGSVRAPLVGLVTILVVLVGALTFGRSADRFVDEPARYGYNFDFATGEGEEEVPPEMRAALEADPAVDALTLYGTILASVGSVALDVTGMQPVRGFLEPEVLSGRMVQGARDIVLGRIAARRLGVGVGDRLDIVGPDGPAVFEVTGLAVIPSVQGGDGVGEGAVVTKAGLARLDAAAGLGAAVVRVRPGASTDQLARRLGMDLRLPDRPPTVRNIDRVRSTPYVVAASLAALTVLSMAHQLLSSARRRRRDLAVLRALGADQRWVAGVIHWQATIVVVAVTAVALPLGVAAGRVVYEVYIDRVGARTDASVPVLLLAALTVGLVVLGNLAALVPARRVRRETPATVLADQ